MEPRIFKTRLGQLSNSKAKVKVQYIANHETLPTDEEIENVEYLEECHVIDDNTTLPPHNSDDAFYPNAIHCLISMYHSRYDKLLGSMNPQQIRLMTTQIWQKISKDMRDCYFDFNALQVQHKFMQLRQKYFDVTSKSDIEEFEYFQPLHALYQDKYINEILNSSSSVVNKLPRLRVYRDDMLFSAAPEDNEKFEENDNKLNTKISADIAHKENEVLDLVERELQAMEQENDTKIVEDSPSLPNLIKQELSDESTDASPPIAKRFKLSISASDDHMEQNEMPQIQKSPENCAATIGTSMSLADYNIAQQRRHDEKMSLMRQGLLLQEKAIEVQRQLMEKLIARL